MTYVCETPTTAARLGPDATAGSNSDLRSSTAVASPKLCAAKGRSGRYRMLSGPGSLGFRRLTRVPKRITVFGSILILASGIGHILRHPAGDSGESAQIVTNLVDGRATPELVPKGFEDEMGYRPVWAEGTLVNPRGACSTPGGVGPDSFETACRVHDFGYDMLRYAESRGTRMGPWARFDLDRHLYGDLLRVCEKATCRATATVYYAAVTLNSIRQGYVAPTEEPTVPWAAAAVGVVCLATAPIDRFRLKQQRTMDRVAEHYPDALRNDASIHALTGRSTGGLSPGPFGGGLAQLPLNLPGECYVVSCGRHSYFWSPSLFTTWPSPSLAGQLPVRPHRGHGSGSFGLLFRLTTRRA
jgi:hypothetical protein